MSSPIPGSWESSAHPRDVSRDDIIRDLEALVRNREEMMGTLKGKVDDILTGVHGSQGASQVRDPRPQPSGQAGQWPYPSSPISRSTSPGATQSGQCFQCRGIRHLKRERPDKNRGSSPQPNEKRVTFSDQGQLLNSTRSTPEAEVRPIIRNWPPRI